jgi:hypothetical protein
MPTLGPRLGVTIQQRGDLLPLVASLGLSVARINVPLYDLMPTGPDDWTPEWLDAIVAECGRLHLIPYAVIGKAAPWHASDPGDLPPLEDWQRFCARFAAHFLGGIQYIGVWNEWQGSPGEYAHRLLIPAAEQFRRVSADYRLCGPELATEGDWPQRLREILDLAGTSLDYLTIHVYQDTGRHVWDVLTRPTRWYEFWRQPSVRQVIEAAGYSHLPLWLTEFGWQSSAVGDTSQAAYAQEVLERLDTATFPAGVLWFQAIDEPTNTWGLYDLNGQPKPICGVISHYTGGAHA